MRAANMNNCFDFLNILMEFISFYSFFSQASSLRTLQWALLSGTWDIRSVYLLLLTIEIELECGTISTHIKCDFGTHHQR